MYDEKKSIPCTTHSINPVPFIICEEVKLKKKQHNFRHRTVEYHIWIQNLFITTKQLADTLVISRLHVA